MEYKCLTNNKLLLNQYALIPLRKEDILNIKNWRNEQIKILRQKKILSDEDQINYYNTVILPLFEAATPSQLLFSLLKNEICIGYGGLVHISWVDRRAELSFLLQTNRTIDKTIYENDFTYFLSLIKKIAFDELGFNRIYTETFDIRDHHIYVLEKNGFKYEGRMTQHVLIDNYFIDSLIHGYLRRDFYEE